MMYLIFFTKHALRLFKKLEPFVKSFLVIEIDKLSKNSYDAPQLKGAFSFLRSKHVFVRGLSYRIIFEIKESDQKIIIHLVAKRADVYRLLERLFR